MRRIKRIVMISIVAGIALAAVWVNGLAQTDSAEPEVVIAFFWRDGCSHCAAEKPFLRELTDQNPQVVLKDYEVYYNMDNREYMIALGEAMGFETDGVPVTVIGDQVWIGYDEAVREEIESAVAAGLETGCPAPADANDIDADGTIVSPDVAGVEEEQSSFPVWIIIVVALIVLSSYIVGSAKAKSKSVKKPARRRR